MVFWRKKNNASAQEQDERDDKILHHPREPDLEPVIENEVGISADVKHSLEETDSEIIDAIEVTPIPDNVIAARETREEGDNGGGWFSQLSKGLSKSSNKLDLGLSDLFKRKLDTASYETLEDILIEADLGPKTAAMLVDQFRARKFEKDVTPDEVKSILAQDIAEILKKSAYALETKKPEDGPRVYLICGVNGAGKTTTIGKLAHLLHFKLKKKVIIAAADTFRAAAIEQLKVWADRTMSPLIAKDIGADAAAVSFEAYEKAVADGADILMIDTAGRLQNKTNLMEELQKIIRVIKKKNETIPHEILLVLDATTGQNAISQVETFMSMVQITGLVVTKLDGSAKGGVVVALAEQFGIPVYAVGVGEGIEDLQPFRPEAFAKALVGLS
ncbi:MAG: signal recognition particle-docking protein FtsY [Micavibrio aeruginosavorus]|uniref:Signal recognition particle receptor FtsY n=1 Tax=Micavibrio aeruginosavorus TaxID=349221 RepID=A0A2W5HU48_9BACT|nr:MAG: signal recognition particle-docking protein FtsY [Micavibrio aeruginosavorus]